MMNLQGHGHSLLHGTVTEFAWRKYGTTTNSVSVKTAALWVEI